jgi:inosine-uridine nucleoside N-ribohydrolase
MSGSRPLALDWPLVRPRARVIVDNDFSGDPDDLVQMAHHLLSPSVDIRAIIASHLSVGDPWDKSTQQASNALAKVNELLEIMGLAGRYVVLKGAEAGLTAANAPQVTPAAEAIIAEAMRDDTDQPLFFAAGAGLTELASAWLMEPRIGKRITLVWIGGPEYPDIAPPPPRSSGPEYNLRIDIAAAQVVFNRSDIAIWQVPRSTYRQLLLSYAELLVSVRPHGALGRYLADNIERVMQWTSGFRHGIGETYVMGDSPLVTLTALQSSFEADPSSSSYVTRPAPEIADDGSYGTASNGRPIRVYTQIDTRLTFADFFAKLQLAAHS